ncbi:MAG: DUF1499 domain-containing protein [Gemmatimonadota bacterium]|nr:DUF1499 domain-containing protein [Gemmatimonadota bacterium]
MMTRILRAITRNEAQTHPAAPDPRLRGRRYAIPFDRVWSAATLLADEGLPGWRVQTWNDRDGIIQAEARGGFLRRTDDVIIRITLDETAQTRVDLTSRSRSGGVDFGTNARRITTFLEALDAKLGATPAQILDAGAGRRPPSPPIGLRA